MSKLALEILIESELITTSGKPVDLSKLPAHEVSRRISNYINQRSKNYKIELTQTSNSDFLNALFSSESTDLTDKTILSSSLIYHSIIIDDPLVTSSSEISLSAIKNGVSIFCNYFKLIKLDFIKIIPLSLFNRPSNEVPMLMSDDYFKSSIPENLHDFIHANARLKSVIQDEKGRMLILKEDASENQRTALNVGFHNDFWKKGVQLFLHQTVEDIKSNNTNIQYKSIWNPQKTLDKESFDRWSYQTINQAMRIRLKNIYNETALANKLGHTYITESEFESNLLSRSAIDTSRTSHNACQFFEANKSLVNIENPETIIKLRDKYPSAFKKFNNSILYAAEHLKDVEPEEFSSRSQLYFESEIQPQIDSLRANARAIGRAATKGALFSLGGLATAIISGSNLPLIPSMMVAAAGGLTESLDSVGKHQEFKKTPAYIWHRITKT